MSIDRRAFLALGSVAASGTLLAAWNSDGPDSARGLLRFAERTNEKLERRILRARSRDVLTDVLNLAADVELKFTSYLSFKSTAGFDFTDMRREAVDDS